MNFIKYNPTGNVFSLRNDINNLVDNFLGSSQVERSSITPRVNVYECGDKLILEAEVPNIKKENIDVEIKGGFLYLSGEYKPEYDVKDEDYHIRERFVGKFSRSFNLPSYVDPDKIDASYENGVLKLEIGKLDVLKAKQIKIK